MGFLKKTQRTGFGQCCVYITFTGNAFDRTIITYLRVDVMPGRAGTRKMATSSHIEGDKFGSQAQGPLESGVLQRSRL